MVVLLPVHYPGTAQQQMKSSKKQSEKKSLSGHFVILVVVILRGLGCDVHLFTRRQKESCGHPEIVGLACDCSLMQL